MIAKEGEGERLAGRQGFEPRYADPESAVLPLDDLPTEFHFSRALKRVSTDTYAALEPDRPYLA